MRGPKNVCPNRGQRAHRHVPASGITWSLVSVTSVSVLHPLLRAPPPPSPFQPTWTGGGVPLQGHLEACSRARAPRCGSRPPLGAHGTCCSSLPPFPPAGNPSAAALRERKRGPAGAPGLEAKAVRGERRLAAPPAALGAQGASPSSLQEAHPGEEARGGVLQPAALGAVGLQHVRGRAPRVPRRSCAVQARCFLHASTQGGPSSGQRPPDSACARARVCACASACACSSSPLGGSRSASQAPGPLGPAAPTAEPRGQRRRGSGGARRTVFLVRPPLSRNTLSTTDV